MIVGMGQFPKDRALMHCIGLKGILNNEEGVFIPLGDANDCIWFGLVGFLGFKGVATN